MAKLIGVAWREVVVEMDADVREDDAQLRARVHASPLPDLLAEARALRDRGFGALHSYSPKIFIPLTQLCRDLCHYCTFSRPPERGAPAYLSPEQVLDLARAGAEAGCTEALFTLGDKPELRFAAARDALRGLGHETTLSYLHAMCDLVLRETGLLPHVNAGVMGREEMAALRQVSASQGLMLESVSERLCAPGGPHYRSPDKQPAARLETIRIAGELAVPFTSGILIGIGETRDERIDALLALRDLHRRHGHIQEIIVQNFRAKPRTPMADHAEPDLDDLMWTIAVARLIFGPEMHIQAPPNLSDTAYPRLIHAGIDDWGGISPVTPDHVNPEAAWPELEALERNTAQMGKVLVPRLPIYPRYALDADRWLDPAVAAQVRRSSDTQGFARADIWSPGKALAPVIRRHDRAGAADPAVGAALDAVLGGATPSEADLVTLFGARGADVDRLCDAADAVRRQMCGDEVTYVVNRNINYTNICLYSCGFCAFSKGRGHAALRGAPYDIDLGEIVRRAEEAWVRGATEVCLQGGIHPHYSGEHYLAVCRAVRAALPDMHIHAFSPLEVHHGATSLGMSVPAFLAELRDAGLSTLPGTAAEILDDAVRAVICPDKLTTQQWLDVVEASHEAGFRTTATIMFGHVERPEHWARHLLHIRALQARTQGFTEFVPLPFVHMEAPMAQRGLTRRGPTFREVRLMHAVARLALHPLIGNIQTSWVKLGAQGVAACLQGGANDLGGTLMNESISRAAGTQHGQEMPPEAMDAIIAGIGRTPRQRTTLYGAVTPERLASGRMAAPLAPLVLTASRRKPGKITVTAEGAAHAC